MAVSRMCAQAGWEAIGTTVVLKVTDERALEPARVILEREIGAIDRTCSRFRDDSDLTQVNRTAGHWTAVDPLLIEALTVALRAAELTDGAVDPTLGGALVLAGYDRDWKLIERATEGGKCAASNPNTSFAASPPRLRLLARRAWRAVSLDSQNALVKIPKDVALDLGATAKAWIADRASETIAARCDTGVLVSIGGDIAVAGPPPEAGWRIHVTDDHRDDVSAPGQTISIRSGGLATSSVTVRRWQRQREQMHHIIDPSTELPSRGPWRTASVAASSCVDANIASTATLAMGEDGLGWLEGQGLPSRLVAHDGRALALGGWPLEEVGSWAA